MQNVACGLGAHAIQVDAQAAQHVDGNAFALAHKPKQQVLGADIVVAHEARLVDGQLNHPLGAGGQGGLAKGRAFAAADCALDGADNLAGLHAQLAQNLDGNAVFLAHKAEQQMLGADIVVVEAQRFFLGQRQNATRTLGEAIQFVRHGVILPSKDSEYGRKTGHQYSTTGWTGKP